MLEARVAAIDAALVAALPEGSLHAVGGRVRDEVRSALEGIPLPAKDLDYVVIGVSQDELMARLRDLGPADVVGASFSVVKVALFGESVDVALPRRERSTGVGHREFAVDSGPQVPLEDDLARRDFRMNMLARRLPGGELIDPYGGAEDILAKRIDLLREEAFAEDPLRMLRACQFAARFGYSVTPRTLAAMRAAAPLVATVSPERIGDELAKFLIAAERPSTGFDLMREGGLLPFVLPELDEGFGVEQNEFHAYDVYRHNLETLDAVPPGDLTLRLAALLHDIGKPRTKDGPHFYRHEIVGAEMAVAIVERLRLSAEVAQRVENLVLHHMYVADADQKAPTIRRFIRRITPELLERQFRLRAADIRGSGLPKRGAENERFEARVREVLAERPALSVRDLQLGGDEVVAALVAAGRLPKGSRGGPEVGALLSKLLEQVIDDPNCNQHDRLREALDRLLAMDDGAKAIVSRETPGS